MKDIISTLLLVLIAATSNARAFNLCNEDGYYLPSGGFVSYSAHVDPTVIVERDSAVCNHAKVYDHVKILEKYSIIGGDAQIHDDCVIKHSIINGNTDLRKNTMVVRSSLEHTKVTTSNCIIDRYWDKYKPYNCGPPLPCEGQPGEYRSSGGFVAATATVDPTVYVERGSEVCDTAHVYNSVRMIEGSVVRGNVYINNGIIKNSYITGTCVLRSNNFITNSLLIRTNHYYDGDCTIENYNDAVGPFECDPSPAY